MLSGRLGTSFTRATFVPLLKLSALPLTQSDGTPTSALGCVVVVSASH